MISAPICAFRAEVRENFDRVHERLDGIGVRCMQHAQAIAGHEAAIETIRSELGLTGKALMRLIAVVGTIVAILSAGFVGLKISEAVSHGDEIPTCDR